MEDVPIYYDENKIWWVWDYQENKYTIKDEVDILNIIDESTDVSNIANQKKRGEILITLQMVARKKKPITPPKTWVQFKNKVIDINTKETFDCNPKYFFVNPIPHNIGSSWETPVIDKLFTDWVGESQKISLYEILAYCFYQDYPIHRLFYLVGTGRNGKSTYLQVCSNLLGNNNRCTTDIDLLLDNRFEVTKLYKKLICILGEANYTAIKKTGLLKKLSGNDPIGFEFKNKTPFDDYNYSKIIIATNSLPETYDKTDGYYRRQFVLEFNNKFKEGKDILKDISEQEYENLCFKLISILSELLKRGSFTNDLSIEDKKKLYEEKSNPFITFLNNECEKNENYEIPFYVFYDTYIQYISSRGYNVHNQSKISISKRLSEEGIETELKRNGEKVHKVLIGLKFKEKENVTHVTNVTHSAIDSYMIEASGNELHYKNELQTEKKGNLRDKLLLFLENKPDGVYSEHIVAYMGGEKYMQSILILLDNLCKEGLVMKIGKDKYVLNK